MTTNERTAVTAIVYVAIALILFLLATSPAHAQVRYGMLGDQPMRLIAHRYNPDSVKPAGFCIGPDVEREAFIGDARDRFITVHSIVEAFTVRVDTTWWVDSTGRDSTRRVSEVYRCSLRTPSIHFHSVGNCNPSRPDYEALLEEGHEFGVIFCGVPRFYWREEAAAMLAPPLQVRRASTGQPRANALPFSERARRPWLRAQLVAASAGIAGIFDPDHSLWTDPDPWHSKDKLLHLAGGSQLYALCRAAGAGKAESVGCGVLGSAFWEVGQAVDGRRRFMSLKDIAAGATGAVSGWVVEKALERFRR